MDLDSTDVAILRALQEDARRSFREIARRVGVSVPTVSARVANLEALGILGGYHAAIVPERLRQVRAILAVRCRPSRSDAVAAEVAAAPEVRWTVRTEDSRVFAEAVLPDRGLLGALVTRFRRVDGVTACEVHVGTGTAKDEPRVIVPDGATASVACYECGSPIEGRPVRLRLGGRTHYLCCPTCERLYRERYERLRSKAGPPTRRTSGGTGPSRTGA